MKYLKRINELFDDEDLKSQFEITYLKGELGPDIISNWKPMKNELDSELASLVNECPYLIEFKYRRSGNVLAIGFDNTINYDDKNSVFYYFLIEVVKFRDEYSLNVYAKCHGNGQQLYNESMIKKTMPYKDLVSMLRRPVFNMVVDFNNFIDKMFKEDNFPYKDVDDIFLNPRLN